MRRKRSDIRVITISIVMISDRDKPLQSTQDESTVPSLTEEEGEVVVESEDPTTKLLRRVLTGFRESDVSRIKLAKISAPT